MANWITHQFIAQRILEELPYLCTKEFCVGSVAPDCNLENDDWTAFIPPREVTHFMQRKRKSLSDCQWFLDHYLSQRTILSKEEASFWWGYYAHLIVDAAFQHLICDDPQRTQAMWSRMSTDPVLRKEIDHISPSWKNAKQIIPFQCRKNDMDLFEKELLEKYPDSPFLTLLPFIDSFPDYVPFLPPGAISRKLKVMVKVPAPSSDMPFSGMLISKDEYFNYIDQSLAHCIYSIQSHISLTPVF